MSIFKEKSKSSKKIKKEDKKTTLDSRHNEMINEFRQKKKEIPTLEKKLKQVNNNLNKLIDKGNVNLTEEEFDTKFNLIEEKDKLMKEIENLKLNTDTEDYLLQTSHMLFHYYDENNNSNFDKTDSISENNYSSKKTVIDFFSNKNQGIRTKEIKNNREEDPYNKEIKNIYENKKEIMDKYFSIVNKDYKGHLPSKLNDKNHEVCKNCNEARIFDSVHGVLVCPNCGCQEKILIDSDTPSYKEPPREITYFAYKKINHANEFLSQFQAKESTDINSEVFEKILEELKKEHYLDISNITTHKVREILKKLELTKYYEHCHYITNRITGKPAPTLSSDLEEKLRNMFKEVQGPWIDYCPSERANFFSYPYIFYKFFQLLDKDEYLPYCRLLKSREKLQEHDEVWRKICFHLKWQFIPTV